MKKSNSKKRVKSRGGLPPNKYLTREQANQLIKYNEQLKASINNQIKQRAVINGLILDVLLNSGLRASEFCVLQMRDLPHIHGKLIIDVRKGKGCVQRSVEISTDLAKRINQFVKRYRKYAKLRSPLIESESGDLTNRKNIWSKLRILGKVVGITNLHPHVLRHTYGYLLYNHCKDLLFLADQMGHKSITTTAIYARTGSTERRRIVESFGV
jgi:integrase